MPKLQEQLESALNVLRSKISNKPKYGIVLGTGLGNLVQRIKNPISFPYDKLPGFPTSTVKTHKGQLTFGQFNGQEVVVMEGRFHYYEGYSTRQITFPIRVMKDLGIETIILTCAAGSMNPATMPGQVVILRDHVYLIPESPLRGPNIDSQGPRFPDMSNPYDLEIIKLVQEVLSKKHNTPIPTGILATVPGPQLETSAEYRALSQMADLVCMSTAPEVIVARHCGLKVAAFAVVTDQCVWDNLHPITLDEIIENANKGAQILEPLLYDLIGSL